MTEFHMPSSWYDPPDPHECDNPDCEGDEDACAELWESIMETAAIERADSIRKGEY